MDKPQSEKLTEEEVESFADFFMMETRLDRPGIESLDFLSAVLNGEEAHPQAIDLALKRIWKNK